MTDWYIKNLAWIRARDKLLYRRLLEMVEPRPEADWSVVDSMMRPKEWLFGLGSFMPQSAVIMYGFGDGEHILHVLERMDEKGHLILMIPDIPEFLEMMHVADMEILLRDARVLPVVLGINHEMMLRYIGACYNERTIDTAKVLILPEYDVLYPEGLTFVEQALEIMIQWMHS